MPPTFRLGFTPGRVRPTCFGRPVLLLHLVLWRIWCARLPEKQQVPVRFRGEPPSIRLVWRAVPLRVRIPPPQALRFNSSLADHSRSHRSTGLDHLTFTQEASGSTPDGSTTCSHRSTGQITRFSVGRLWVRLPLRVPQGRDVGSIPTPSTTWGDRLRDAEWQPHRARKDAATFHVPKV